MGFEDSSRSAGVFVGVNARGFVLVMARGKATKFGVEKKDECRRLLIVGGLGCLGVEDEVTVYLVTCWAPKTFLTGKYLFQDRFGRAVVVGEC
jgi:hypothetical protein